MGLISRVSSRTYRTPPALKKAFKKNGGVQFSTHPANLKNKNTLKYSGMANSKTVALQADNETKGVSLAFGGKKVATWKGIKGLRPVVVRTSNAVGRYNPALKAVARKRASAIMKAQRK